ncbi:MAG: D-alanine--D-alanine ligase [Chitinophagales bacterium]
MKKRIAILTGGNSAELEISLASASVVSNNLNREKYEVLTVNISPSPWKATDDNGNQYRIDLNDFSYNNGKDLFDIVFMAIHGTPGEDGKLQGYFDTLNIPYTCAGVLASAITFDKDICKQLLKDVDVKQAKSILLHNNKLEIDKIENTLQFPLFVKPNKNGSSYGISKVKEDVELEIAIKKSFQYDDEVLVEEFIEGRELACGVVEKNSELIALPITEIISENEFFDYEAKYEGKSKEITPADLNQTQVDLIHRISKVIYRALKLKGAIRVDYFLNDELYLLEVNTIPGFSAESIIPQQALAHGFSLEEFFSIMIEENLK